MHHSNSLQEIVILLTAAVAVVAIFRQFNLSPVLGFLFAGAVIGPSGFKWVGDLEQKSYIAEFGVVFLLFTIGLELSFKRLREMRRYVLGLGGLQVIFTAVAIGFLAHYDLEWQPALIVGGALAMSSTAVVLQLLAEKGERHTQVGRVSFSILLLQDLAVIPLLVVMPILSKGGTGDILQQLGISFGYAIAAVIILLLIGRFLLKPILSVIANVHSPELFVATTLLVVLSAAYATEHFGLSLAFGAFIAGLMVAETEFRKQVEIDIEPFKGLLMGLFFMTVGMSFNLNELLHQFPDVVKYAAQLILVKATIVILLCRFVTRLGWETSIKSGFMLAQGSEFAFVLFGLALDNQLVATQTGHFLLMMVSFSMAVSPLIYGLVVYIFRKIQEKKVDTKNIITGTEDLGSHFVICGFGWVGENLAKLFAEEGINFVAIEQETKRVKAGREMGLPVYYGDATRHDILESLQVKKAKAVIVTIHDSKPVKRIVQTIRTHYKDVTIVARAKHIESVEALKEAGATIVVPEAYESAMMIAKNAMTLYGYGDKENARAISQYMEDRLDSES